MSGRHADVAASASRVAALQIPHPREIPLPSSGVWGIDMTMRWSVKRGQAGDVRQKIPTSPEKCDALQLKRAKLVFNWDIFPKSNGRFSLALEAWTGACFALAALLPPKFALKGQNKSVAEATRRKVSESFNHWLLFSEAARQVFPLPTCPLTASCACMC